MSPSPTAAAVVSHPLYAIALLSEANSLTGYNANSDAYHKDSGSGESTLFYVVSSGD
jgi:hypothetical protein